MQCVSHCIKIWFCNNNERINAKIGKEITNQEVAGKYTLHDVTSGNGQKLIQFAQIHGIFVVSTKYKHTTIPNGTHIIPGKMEKN